MLRISVGLVVLVALLIASAVIAIACWVDNYIPVIVVWLITGVILVILTIKVFVVMGLIVAHFDKAAAQERGSKWVDEELKKARRIEKTQTD